VNAKTRARYEARAKVVKAMAHPTRLFIVDQLSTKELCVAELTELIEADMSTVSKHLSVLKGVGIIADDKRGAQVYYRLKTPCMLNFFKCVETVLEKSAKDQLAIVR
jgi:ArsR family transcriptional regulator